jgi:hypothetical protein
MIYLQTKKQKKLLHAKNISYYSQQNYLPKILTFTVKPANLGTEKSNALQECAI